LNDIVELINELERLRVDVVATDGRIKINAPAGVIDDAMRAVVRVHRDELLWAVLSWPNHAWGRCDRCGICRLVPVRRKGDAWRCLLTPGCQGATVPRTWRPTNG